MPTGVAPWGLGQGGGKASLFSPAGHPPGQLQQRCERVNMMRESCPVCDQPHGRLLPFGRWHSEVQLHEYSLMKESASGRAKITEKSGTMERQESESARCESPPLSASSPVRVRLRKPFGQVPRGLGECSRSEFLM